MDTKELMASSRSMLNDPFVGSSRRRVEWSSDRKPAVFKPKVEIPIHISQDIISVLNCRTRTPQTPTSVFPQKQFHYWPTEVIQVQKQVPQKDIHIDEIVDRSNPAYRTFDSSWVSKPQKVIETPPTNLTENMGNTTNSFVNSQVSGRPLRETKSFLLTNTASPKPKESSLFSSLVQDVKITSFPIKPQTPQAKPHHSFSDHFSIMKTEVPREKFKSEISNAFSRHKTPDVPSVNVKIDLPSKDYSLSNSSISRQPLTLKRNATSVDIIPSQIQIPTQKGDKRRLESEICALNNEIQYLKTKLASQDVVYSQSFLDSVLRKQQETEKEYHLIQEALGSLRHENETNSRKLATLHLQSASKHNNPALGNQDDLMKENALLKAKLHKILNESAGKTAKKIETMKQQVLTQLTNEAKFTKLKYLTDKQAIACDLKAYLAYLEDQKANRPSIPNRPSQM